MRLVVGFLLRACQKSISRLDMDPPKRGKNIIKIKIHSRCEIEYFVETRLCKLCVILRYRPPQVKCRAQFFLKVNFCDNCIEVRPYRTISPMRLATMHRVATSPTTGGLSPQWL